MSEPRYILLCVAPEIPNGGSYHHLDEAMLAADANFEVYDREEGRYVGGPFSREEWLEWLRDKHIRQACEMADKGGMGPMLVRRGPGGGKGVVQNLAAFRYAAFHLLGHEEHEVLCVGGPLAGQYLTWLDDMTGLYPDGRSFGHYAVSSDPRLAEYVHEEPGRFLPRRV